MTRFKKEMQKHFPGIDWQGERGETSAFCVPEKALVVFDHPALVVVLEFQRNGKQREVTSDYPEYSAPYLVYLCGGDKDRAREILKRNDAAFYENV